MRLNLLRFRLFSIYALPRDVDVRDCFDKPVKTSCGFVNIARNAEIAQRKVFFQPKLQVFPHSDRIWTAL